MAERLGAVLLPAEAGVPTEHGGEIAWRSRGQRAVGKTAGALTIRTFLEILITPYGIC